MRFEVAHQFFDGLRQSQQVAVDAFAFLPREEQGWIGELVLIENAEYLTYTTEETEKMRVLARR